MMPTTYLLTGATGFLGKHIFESLSAKSHAVTTLGRDASNNILCDLSKQIPFFNTRFDVMVHAAGKAHLVPKTEAEKKDFFDVNLEGTKNLCVGLTNCDAIPKAFIFISTVAVYGLDEGENISEKNKLLGNTPYAKSKIEAEKFVMEWCQNNKVVCTLLRLPLVAGKNPPGNLDAMIEGIVKGRYFNIGGGKAKKSVVLANDVANILPIAGSIGGVYNLTDGYHPSFKELADKISNQLAKHSPKSIPLWVAKTMALVGNMLGDKAPINTEKLKKITATLTFNDDLAKQKLGWKPNKVLDHFNIK